MSAPCRLALDTSISSVPVRSKAHASGAICSPAAWITAGAHRLCHAAFAPAAKATVSLGEVIGTEDAGIAGPPVTAALVHRFDTGRLARRRGDGFTGHEEGDVNGFANERLTRRSVSADAGLASGHLVTAGRLTPPGPRR